MADIIKIFKDLRRENQLTQKQVSENTGVSVITVYTWEAGQRQPTLDNFEKVLNNMGYELSIKPLEAVQ